MGKVNRTFSLTDLVNRRVEGIKFFSAYIAQDQGIIVGRETCPDRVAKPRLPYSGQTCHCFGLSVRHANSLDRRVVTSFENVDKSAIRRPVGVAEAVAAREFVPGLSLNIEKKQRKRVGGSA
jgi:hypothetical protein